MWTTATISAPISEMPLTETFETLADYRFRVEESAFGEGDQRVCLWFADVAPAELEAALDADPSAADVSQVTARGEESLYQIELVTGLLVPRNVIQGHGGTIREAHGRDGQWTFEVRFPDRDALSDTADELEAYGVTIDCQSITSGPGQDRMDALTENQRDLLQAAIDEGYYEIPRAATLEDLAEQQGISHQALSESLRRAQSVLVESTVAVPDDTPDDVSAGS